MAETIFEGTFPKGGRTWVYRTSGNVKGIYYETNQQESNRVLDKYGNTTPYTGEENGKYYVLVSGYEKQSNGTWKYYVYPPGRETANGNAAQAQAIGADTGLKQQVTGSVTNTNPTNPNQPGTPGTSTPTSPPNQNTGTTVGILRYPLSNVGKYDYIKITTHELIRDANLLGSANKDLGVVGPEKQLSPSIGPTIALPMQPGISDSNSVDWGSDQLNPLQLALGRAAASGIRELGNNFSIQGVGNAATKMMNEVTSSVLSAGGDLTESDIVSYFAGQAVGANFFTRSTGKIINPNLELLFRGPQLRSFNYSFRFTPRDPDEAKTIKAIIKHFKKHMAVKRSDVGLFLKTPDVFKLQYIYLNGDQHPFLNKIKPCALTNFNVDYTPDGSYMTYKDGSMTSYGMTMQFSELAPIYENDYDNSDDMGY